MLVCQSWLVIPWLQCNLDGTDQRCTQYNNTPRQHNTPTISTLSQWPQQRLGGAAQEPSAPLLLSVQDPLTHLPLQMAPAHAQPPQLLPHLLPQPHPQPPPSLLLQVMARLLLLAPAQRAQQEKLL